MELKNCEECGRTFGSVDGATLCKRCFEKRIEDEFKIVRNYLYDHPNTDIKIVSKDTGVSERIILKLLREDRIKIAEENNNFLKCEMCGTSIQSGRLCEKCKKLKVAKELKKAGNEIKNSLEKEKQITYHSSRK